MKRTLSLVLVLVLCASMFVTLKPDQVNAASKTPAKPSISLSAGKDGKSVTVTIEKTKNAEGFLIYMKSSGDSKYTKIKTLKKNGSARRTYTVKNLSSGTYSFKVKGYLKEETKTVKGKYSTTKTLKVKASKSTEFTPVKSYDLYKQHADWATNTYDETSLSSSVGTKGKGIYFDKAISIQAEEGNQIFDLSDTDRLAYFKENDELTYWYNFDLVGDFAHTDYYDTYNSLNIIPVLSKANTEGLDKNKTILGTSSIEEGQALLESWMEAANTVEKNYSNKNGYRNYVSFNNITISDDGKEIEFAGSLGSTTISVNDTTFSSPVYELSVRIPNLDTTKDFERYSGTYMRLVEELSFITAYPYEVATKLTGTNGKSSDSIRKDSNFNKWIRVNDLLLYCGAPKENGEFCLYAKPVE